MYVWYALSHNMGCSYHPRRWLPPLLRRTTRRNRHRIGLPELAGSRLLKPDPKLLHGVWKQVGLQQPLGALAIGDAHGGCGLADERVCCGDAHTLGCAWVGRQPQFKLILWRAEVIDEVCSASMYNLCCPYACTTLLLYVASYCLGVKSHIALQPPLSSQPLYHV